METNVDPTSIAGVKEGNRIAARVLLGVYVTLGYRVRSVVRVIPSRGWARCYG